MEEKTWPWLVLFGLSMFCMGAFALGTVKYHDPPDNHLWFIYAIFALLSFCAILLKPKKY